jgi:hypothetical protein
MTGKLLTPEDPNAPKLPGEFNVMVLVNGKPTAYPLAVLAVQSDIATSLTRIADVLEAYRDQQPWYASERSGKLAEVVPLRKENGPLSDDLTGAPTGGGTDG